MAVFLSLIFGGVLLWSIFHYERVLNPASLLAIPNFLALVLLLGSNWLNSNLSVASGLIVVVGLIFYVAGVKFGEIVRIRRSASQRYGFSQVGYSRVLIVVSAFYDVFGIMYLYQMQSQFGLLAMFGNLTEVNIAQQDGSFSGVFSYFLPVSFPLSALLLYRLKLAGMSRGKLMACVFQLVFCFLPYLFSARRSLLFSLIVFVALFTLLVISDRRNAWRIEISSLAKGGLLLFAIWLALMFMSSTQQLMNKASTGTGYAIFGISLPGLFIDPIDYIAGNYAYFDKSNDFDALLNGNSAPFVATLRMVYLYILPYFGISIDADSLFANALINIGDNGYIAYFNTEPIFYYSILDAGLLFPLVLFLLGCVTQKAYEAIRGYSDIGVKSCCVLILAIVFWSFRSYDLIFLTTWLALFYSLIVHFLLKLNSVIDDGGNLRRVTVWKK